MGFLVALTAVLDSQLKARSSRVILEGAPYLRDALAATNRRETVLVVAAGALFMVAVFLAGILESRRTAGPILNLRRRLEELRAGRLGARVILRRHDNFPELAGAFNEMAGAIRSRAEGELATLGRLANQVSDLLREEARGNRMGVRQIAETIRRALEDARRRKGELLRP
jgi:methyl-accepting chemotaxis protein